MRDLLLAVTCVFVGGASAFGAEQQKHDHTAMTGMAKPAKASTPAQKTCPVTGKPIREDVFIEQDGTKVYFCCPACIPKLKASPMKYLAGVYRQDYPQSVQVKCPVMGGPLDGKTFIEYQGRRIGFCCGGCPEKFKADPAKYLARQKEWSTDQVHCPVTGGAIDPKLTTQYQGKTAYFSSTQAASKFKADPAKYAAALRPEAGVVARGASADDDLVLTLTSAKEASIFKRKDLKAATYEGKTYLLRGDGGMKDFLANPAQYAKALDAELKKYSGMQGTPMSGMGHSSMSHSMHGQGESGMGHGGHQH